MGEIREKELEILHNSLKEVKNVAKMFVEMIPKPKIEPTTYEELKKLVDEYKTLIAIDEILFKEYKRKEEDIILQCSLETNVPISAIRFILRNNGDYKIIVEKEGFLIKWYKVIITYRINEKLSKATPIMIFNSKKKAEEYAKYVDEELSKTIDTITKLRKQMGNVLAFEPYIKQRIDEIRMQIVNKVTNMK